MKLELPVVLSILQGWLHQFYTSTKKSKTKEKNNKARCMGHLVGVLSTSTGPTASFTLCGANRSMDVFCYSMRMRAPGWRLIFYIPAAGRWRDGFWPHAGSPGRVLHRVPAKLHPVPADLRAPHGLPAVALQLPGLPHRLPDHHALQLVGCSYHGRCVRKPLDKKTTTKKLEPRQNKRECKDNELVTG